MKGFTLVELIVVVFLVSVLATVALPAYQIETAKEGKSITSGKVISKHVIESHTSVDIIDNSELETTYHSTEWLITILGKTSVGTFTTKDVSVSEATYYLYEKGDDWRE